MANTCDKVINIAKNEVGYLEKKSNSQLDSKTANAGSANYTKYGKWYGLNPDFWCAMFICWIFNEAYGATTAKNLLCGSFSAACETIKQHFIDKGQYFTSSPKVGDVIFFTGTRHTGANHIGLVTNVSNGRVYTIEGNTSGGSTVIDNGGGVANKSYAISYNRILGYGRPKYDAASNSSTKQTSTTVSNKATTSNTYTQKQFIKDVQSATGAKVDGIAGSETLSKTVTVSKSKNRKHAVVKPIQKYLNLLGHNCGEVDGIAGVKFDAAVRSFQKSKNCVVDGEITKKCSTWKCLLGMKK